MLSLRPRTTSDLITIVSWVPDADSLYLFTGPRFNWPLMPTQLAEMGSDPNFSPWIAELTDHRTVGHFDLRLENDLCRLGRFIIDPDLRGEGLAPQLLQLAVMKAQELGAARMALNVIDHNTRAVRAYQRAGFRATPNHPRPDVLAMELSLQSPMQ